MAQYIDKSALVAEIRKKIRTEQGYSSGDAECGYRDCAREILSFLDTLEVKDVQEEPVSEDLEEAAENYPSIIRTISPQWEAEVESAFNAGAQWQKGNLWKNAQGDELPTIDREVIALLNNGKVVFAHRPYKGKYLGKNLTTGNIETFENKTYDKGGWNQPDVKWWLDIEKLPNMEE
jgi:hypothetical protein